jgi:hypothetical protein
MNLQGWANAAWADGSWVPESWGDPGGMDLTHWQSGVWEAGSWVPESWGDGEEPPAPAVVTPERAVSGRRHRRYRIIEDHDLLQEELRVEEKKVEVEKKKLRVLVKRSESPNVEGVLYQQIQAKVEKLEAKIDDRMEKIAGLMLAIQVGLDEEDDDEEVLLLS